MVISILVSLVILSFVYSAAGPFPGAFENAGEILSDSGYLAMSLTLQIAFPSLVLNSSTATVFAPSDSAFVRSGQPSLALLQYHISPVRTDVDDLESLPIGATIPTLLSNRSLIVTASSFEGQSSINDVRIADAPIYDDGSVVIYGVEEFFNVSFQIRQDPVTESPIAAPRPSSASDDVESFTTKPSVSVDAESFAPASHLLTSRGFSRMATFLDLQLSDSVHRTGLTIFAPLDKAIDRSVRNFRDFSSIFRRHVVPNRLTWTDLAKLDAGTSMPTFAAGFVINVKRYGETLELNGLPVAFPDIYHSNMLAVHGLNRLLSSPEKQELAGDSYPDEVDGKDEKNPIDYEEY